MMAEVNGELWNCYVTVESSPNEVTLVAGNDLDHGPAWLAPAQARELAAALLRAADEAEGKPHLPDVVKQFMEENPGLSATGRRLDAWRPPMQ